MRQALRQPILLGSVFVGAVLAVVVGCAYLGGFTNPVGNLHDVPIAIVNLDEPQEIAGEQLSVGDTFEQELLQRADDAGDKPIRLIRYDSLERARADLLDNELTAVAILPSNLTADVVKIGTSAGKAEPVEVTVLLNEGAGALQPAVVTEAAGAAEDELANSVSTLLVSQLDQLGVQVDPGDAASIGRPVRVHYESTPSLTDRAGRGLPPLYYSVVITLTGLLSAIALHLAVGIMAGREEEAILGRAIQLPKLELDPWERFKVEAALLVPASVLGGLAATATAAWIIDTQVGDVAMTALVSVLGALALAWLTLAVVTGFGELGLLVVVLATTIFGVPSARGVYPVEAMPAFFAALGFLPMRWIVDGARASFYFDGRGAAGLEGSIIVLSLYIAGSLACGVGIARICQRRATAVTSTPHRGSPAGAGGSDHRE